VIAFGRVCDERWMITVVPRLVHALTNPGSFPVGGCWTDTAIVLPPGCPHAFVDVLTGRSITASSDRVEVSAAFAVLPVALLGSAPRDLDVGDA
jgi:maltooligosyltrehalose synthase